MKNKILKPIQIMTIALLLVMPSFAFAVNDVTLNANTNFELNTIDAIPSLTTIVGLNGGQVTNLDIQSKYIDITLDNASNITFNTTLATQYFTINKQSGSDAYTTSPSCITNQITLAGTGAAVVLRLQVTSTVPACAGGGGGGGGGGGTSISPTNTSIIIHQNAAQTDTRQVFLALSASDATQMMISNKQDFSDALWETYQTTKTWTLTENFGIKTVYAKFKSSNGNQSTPISDTINYVQTISPNESCNPDCTKIKYDLYIINPDGTERHINTNFVQSEHLGNSTYLYKFEDKGLDMDYNDIWIIAEQNNCQDIEFNVLKLNGSWHHQIKVRILLNNVIKEDILLWPDSHLAVNQTKTINFSNYPSLCTIPTPPGPCTIDCALFSYDLFIINPDGTERHINTNYSQSESLGNGTYLYKFEDKGVDMDYNDIWIMAEQNNCQSIIFSVIKLDAGWHHQIRVKLIYKGLEKNNILLWSDSHLSQANPKTITLSDYPSLCIQEDILLSGDVFKGSADTVYYYGADGFRYVFPNRNTYITWYSDFNNVKIIDDEILANIPLKNNVTYKPGIRMIKIVSIPNVYVVDNHAVLRWITTEEIAESLYGSDWATFVDDLPDSFFFNYTIGELINNSSEFNPILAANQSPDINTEKQITP